MKFEGCLSEHYLDQTSDLPLQRFYYPSPLLLAAILKEGFYHFAAITMNDKHGKMRLGLRQHSLQS
jgi:hypothetical protein